MNTFNSEAASTLDFTLEPEDARRLATLCGQFDSHIKLVEERVGVDIRHRGNAFALSGPVPAIHTAQQLILQLYQDTEHGGELTPNQVHLALREKTHMEPSESPTANAAASTESATDTAKKIDGAIASASIIKTKKGSVKPRGDNQQRYVAKVRTNDINFGVGPAGTGKTYLAVACAVEALIQDQVERILLVRPAVEAGEKLGFLPGDLAQKVDPYLRPLYDALYEMLGFEVVEKLIEKSVIEIAPLAYMRGRTLNNSFVILDESQNTTREQMKMFLTRIGFGSTAVITGDPSQIDLPKGQASGLKHAIEILDNVEGISFTLFTSKDVVRHPIVQRIVEAYERAEPIR